MNIKESEWPTYWQQLAAMIDAGITIESALRTVDGSNSGEQQVKNKNNDSMRRVIGLVSRGQSLSDSLKQAKCINEADYTILNIAEKSGKLALGLNAISKRRSGWLARIKTLKASLLLPKVLLVLGAFAGVLLRTITQDMSLLDASFGVFATLIFVWSLIEASVYLLKIDSLFWLSFFWPFTLISRRWPIYLLAYEDVFYRMLAWQIEAGVAADIALKSCGSLFASRSFKQSISLASKAVESGESMPNALIGNGLVLSQPLKRVLLTSIEAGSWDRAVLSHLNVQQQRLTLKADDFFKWLPRMYYFIALLTISKFMTA